MVDQKKSHKYTYKYLLDMPTVLSNWSQAITNFRKYFWLLVKEVKTIEQTSHLLSSASCRLRLGKLRKIQSESVQELELLVADMDNQCNFNQDIPQASINRLHIHTIRLRRKTEQIKHLLGLNTFQPVQTIINNAL